MAITGSITPYLDVLELDRDDAKVQALLDAQPGERRTERYAAPFTIYESFESAGMSFLFDDDGLSAIFFYLTSTDGITAHSYAQPLIEGLAARPTMAEVRALLGEPYQCEPDEFDVYRAAERRFVHIEYDTDMVARLVTLMPRLPRES